MRYAELHCKSNFSFLEGASHPGELAEQAAALGYGGLAVTDRNSLAGVVRAHAAAKDLSLPLVIGAELHPVDGPPVLIWASDRDGYARLSRLITTGRGRAEKGLCQLTWADLTALSAGVTAGLLLRQPVAP
jgi:error-prone DNA polymerase